MALAGWKWYQQKIIDHTKIDNDLTNFPVRVHLDNTNFDFTQAQSTGYDIRFVASDGVTLLDYEREQHDATNQVAEYWVRIPSVSSTADTVFYMFWDNSSASDGANPTAVWDSNYHAVYHLSETGTVLRKDSTVYANNGTPYNGVAGATGKIDGANSFDGVDDYVNIPNTGQFNFSGLPFSVSLWINPTLWGDEDTLIDFETKGWNGWLLRYVFGNLTGNNDQQLSVGVPSTGVWTKVTFTSNGTDGKVYFNDVLNNTVSSLTYPNNSTTSYGIGNNTENTVQGFNGLIDEVRISNIARSAAWIKASYHSENNTLISSGAAQLTTTTVTGSVYDKSGNLITGVSCNVKAFNKDTGDLLGSAISNSTDGSFSIDIDSVGVTKVILQFTYEGTYNGDTDIAGAEFYVL